MEYNATIAWKDQEVGRALNITNDMWYFDADWLSGNSEHASKFESIASKLNAGEVMKSIEKGMVVSEALLIIILQYWGR